MVRLCETKIWLSDYVYGAERNVCQNNDQRRTHIKAETHIAENSYKLTTLCCEASTILLGSCGKVWYRVGAGLSPTSRSLK